MSWDSGSLDRSGAMSRMLFEVIHLDLSKPQGIKEVGDQAIAIFDRLPGPGSSSLHKADLRRLRRLANWLETLGKILHSFYTARGENRGGKLGRHQEAGSAASRARQVHLPLWLVEVAGWWAMGPVPARSHRGAS